MEQRAVSRCSKRGWCIIHRAKVPSRIPCTGPLIHMQRVTHTKNIHTKDTLNPGYCNWNKVQWDHDLTPSWPVILVHSLSFFCSFPLCSHFFSLSLCFSEPYSLQQVCKLKPDTHTFACTHTWQHSRGFYYLLHFFHLISSPKIALGVTNTHTHTHSFSFSPASCK